MAASRGRRQLRLVLLDLVAVGDYPRSLLHWHVGKFYICSGTGERKLLARPNMSNTTLKKVSRKRKGMNIPFSALLGYIGGNEPQSQGCTG